MSVNFNWIKFRYLSILAVFVLAYLPALATANSSRILKDISRAAERAAQEPSIGQLSVHSNGGQVTTNSPGGVDLTVSAGKVTNSADGTIVAGKGQSNIVFQQLRKGVFRTSIHISSPNDPERYEFKVRGCAQLRQQFDGSIRAFDNSGQLVAEIETPWSIDANGRHVPTHYETSGAVFTQIVEHRSADFAYAITADPLVTAVIKAGNCVYWVGGKVMSLVSLVEANGGILPLVEKLKTQAKKVQSYAVEHGWKEATKKYWLGGTIGAVGSVVYIREFIMKCV